MELVVRLDGAQEVVVGARYEEARVCWTATREGLCTHARADERRATAVHLVHPHHHHHHYHPRRLAPMPLGAPTMLPRMLCPSLRAAALRANLAPHRHPFTTSAPRRASHFDTHHFVTRLEASGMAREQADALVAALGDVVEESIKNLEKGLVSREEGERWRYSQKVGAHRGAGRVALDEPALPLPRRSTLPV